MATKEEEGKEEAFRPMKKGDGPAIERKSMVDFVIRSTHRDGTETTGADRILIKDKEHWSYLTIGLKQGGTA